jgi:hypothetical protein
VDSIHPLAKICRRVLKDSTCEWAEGVVAVRAVENLLTVCFLVYCTVAAMVTMDSIRISDVDIIIDHRFLCGKFLH